MLKRLQTAQSIYNRKEWEHQHKQTSYIMHNISQNADRNKHEFSYANYFSEYSPLSRPHTSVRIKRNQSREGSEFMNNTYNKPNTMNKMASTGPIAMNNAESPHSDDFKE